MADCDAVIGNKFRFGFPTLWGLQQTFKESFGEDSPAGRISGSMTLVSGAASGGGSLGFHVHLLTFIYGRSSLPAIGISLVEKRQGINTIYMGIGS